MINGLRVNFGTVLPEANYLFFNLKRKTMMMIMMMMMMIIMMMMMIG